jgi:transcriptional regulator with XRE-family HTH domain
MSILATTEQNLALGERLLAVRVAAGLSQDAFAERLGLSPRAYANYERGEREIPAAVVRTLYEVYGTDPLWLLTGPGTDPVYAPERQLNLSLLEELIRIVESSLQHAHKTLKPDKKARLIRLGYEHCMQAGEIDTGRIRDMLSLAA